MMFQRGATPSRPSPGREPMPTLGDGRWHGRASSPRPGPRPPSYEPTNSSVRAEPLGRAVGSPPGPTTRARDGASSAPAGAFEDDGNARLALGSDHSFEQLDVPG